MEASAIPRRHRPPLPAGGDRGGDPVRGDRAEDRQRGGHGGRSGLTGMSVTAESPIASSSPTPRVVLTGAASPLGERVIRQLVHEGIDAGRSNSTRRRGRDPPAFGRCRPSGRHRGRPRQQRLQHPRAPSGRAPRGSRRPRWPPPTPAGAEHVVFVSSAMVYGAFANNPVPLTEEAVLRPDVEFVFARQLASAEELVEQWRLAEPHDRPRCSVPSSPSPPTAAHGWPPAYVSGLGRRLAEDDPPSQFLHLDDLASAITAAISQRLDGVFNVAPDGWVPGERVRALSGERPRVPLPERASRGDQPLAWQFQRADPAGPALVHPRAVGRGQRPAAHERLGADGDQRAGVRRGHRVEVVDDGLAEAPPGVRAGHRRARRPRRRSPWPWWSAVDSCGGAAVCEPNVTAAGSVVRRERRPDPRRRGRRDRRGRRRPSCRRASRATPRRPTCSGRSRPPSAPSPLPMTSAVARRRRRARC